MSEKKYRRVSYAVWEITLKCNLACSHFGSRAGQAKIKELFTKEALDVVRQLEEVGIKEVTLISGEAFMRFDWLEIAQAITEAGMICGTTTGGFGISKACEFAELSRGVCSWTAHVFFDCRGNNPYCHHRALKQAERGIRERVYLVKKADGNSFDNVVFAIIEEPLNDPWIENDPLHFTSDRIQWSESWQDRLKTSQALTI